MFRKITFANIFALAIFVVDRVIKNFFVNHPEFYRGDFFWSLLKFNLVENPGIAFGIPLGGKLLLIILALVIFFVAWFLHQAYVKKNFLEIFSLTLVLSGAISNMLDRLLFGVVIDYIDLSFFTIFNLADVMITVGLMFLILGNLKILNKNKISV